MVTMDETRVGLAITDKDAFRMSSPYQDATLRKSMGQSAKIKVENEFNIVKQSRKLADIYESSVHELNK
jgi:hypothetical protein